MRKLLSMILVLTIIISLCPAILAVQAEEDLYARQVENIPYSSNGQMKFKQTEFGKSFVFDGETFFDAGGTNRMKRLTASNQNEVWRLMLEPAYLFTGWEFNATTEQYNNGEIYAQLDLGGLTPIDEVTVSYLPAANEKNDSDYSISKVPKIYRFDVSDNGVDYTTVKTVTTDLSEYKDTIATKEAYVQAVTTDPEMYDLMHTHRVIFDETVNCRYIRFVMIQPTQDWVYNDGTGNRSSLISDWQLFSYNTWKDQENESTASIAPKDTNGIYQFARKNSTERNIIGFAGEENLSSKSASRVTYKDETISRDWNLDEGAIQSANGNFALVTSDYANYTNGNVYLQYDFGYPERVDVIEQYFRNTEDAAKANDIPKTIRIDYGSKNERGLTEWTQGETFTIDMSDPASVGEKAAAAYNKLLTNGTLTTGEKMYLNQPVRLELTQPIEARFIRIVYLQPTQDGQLPTDKKLKIKKTIIQDLEGLADSNKLTDSASVPFNEDGSVKFINVTDNNIRYEGETNDAYPVSRLKASSYIDGQDWHFRHILSKNTTELGLRAKPANFANGKIWIEYDFGAPIDIGTFAVEFRAFNNKAEKDQYTDKAKYYNTVPAMVRIDYGNIDESNKVVWTEGEVITYDLAAYDLLSKYTETEILTAYNTAEAERTPDQVAIVEAVNSVPTGATYDLGYKNARFLRYVIIDPLQSGIENSTNTTLTWYLRYAAVYGAPAQQEAQTTASITAATENSINYNVTLSDEDAQAVIFAAIYNGDDLIAVKKVTADSTSVTFEASGADTAKIFVWDSLEKIKPLAKAEYQIQ